MRASAATGACQIELRPQGGRGRPPHRDGQIHRPCRCRARPMGSGRDVLEGKRKRARRARPTQTRQAARRPMRASAATRTVPTQGATDGERSLILCVGAALAAARGRAGALRRKHRAGTSPAPTSDSCAARGRRGYGSQWCTGGTRPKARNAGIRGLAWSARRMKASLACWSGPSMAPKPSR